METFMHFTRRELTNAVHSGARDPENFRDVLLISGALALFLLGLLLLFFPLHAQVTNRPSSEPLQGRIMGGTFQGVLPWRA